MVEYPGRYFANIYSFRVPGRQDVIRRFDIRLELV